MSMFSAESPIELDLYSPTIKFAQYLLLIARIQDSTNRLSGPRVVDGHMQKRIEYTSGDALQETSS